MFHPVMHIPQELIQRVQEVFPDVPPAAIVQDLTQTHSVELTIENFLEGRIPIVQPPQQNNPPPQQLNPSPEPRNSVDNSSIVSPTSTTSTTSTTTTSQSTPISNSVDLPKLADVFANTSQERQQRLQSRKQQMLEIARKYVLSIFYPIKTLVFCCANSKFSFELVEGNNVNLIIVKKCSVVTEI